MITNTAGTIYYQGEIYTIFARPSSNLITETPKIKIVSVANRRMELVLPNDPDGLFFESELIRFEDVRRNGSFPRGTVPVSYTHLTLPTIYSV